jgi:hypothetical protein
VGLYVRSRLIKDRPRFTDTLDTIKFICKEVWVAVWDKQVDNLRTNHRVGLSFIPSLLGVNARIADFGIGSVRITGQLVSSAYASFFRRWGESCTCQGVDRNFARYSSYIEEY